MDHVALTDQVHATLTRTAGLVAHHFAALLEQGFDRAEALELARDFQSEWLGRLLDGAEARDEDDEETE